VADLSVVVVTWNKLPWLEQCLESVRGHDVIVVDNGSTDGTVDFVRERWPEVRLIEQENKGMGGGNNAGMRAADGRYFFLLNSDAWVVNDGLDKLIEFADEHPEAAVVGPRLLNPDGTLQRSVRGYPSPWRIATEYFFLRKLAPRSHALNAFFGEQFDHESVREAFFVSFLGNLGVDPDLAFACGFLFFVMTIMLAAPGLAVILWENVFDRRAPVPERSG